KTARSSPACRRWSISSPSRRIASCSSSWLDLRPWHGHSWRRPACPPTRPRCCGAPFDATMQDGEFRAEAARIQADLAPTTGEDVQKLVARIYATPRSVVERVKKLLAP